MLSDCHKACHPQSTRLSMTKVPVLLGVGMLILEGCSELTRFFVIFRVLNL